MVIVSVHGSRVWPCLSMNARIGPLRAAIGPLPASAGRQDEDDDRHEHAGSGSREMLLRGLLPRTARAGRVRPADRLPFARLNPAGADRLRLFEPSQAVLQQGQLLGQTG